MTPNFTTYANGFDYDFYIIKHANDDNLSLFELINESLYFNDEPVYAEGTIKNYSDFTILQRFNVPFKCVNGLMNCYQFIIIKKEFYKGVNEQLAQNFN